MIVLVVSNGQWDEYKRNNQSKGPDKTRQHSSPPVWTKEFSSKWLGGSTCREVETISAKCVTNFGSWINVHA